MNCGSYDTTCVFVFFFLGYSSTPRVTGAGPVTTNLTKRVSVRTTTTTTNYIIRVHSLGCKNRMNTWAPRML